MSNVLDRRRMFSISLNCVVAIGRHWCGSVMGKKREEEGLEVDDVNSEEDR